jgi:hypothetical protein
MPGDDEPPPAATLEQHTQLGKQHPKKGGHLDQLRDEWRKAGKREAGAFFCESTGWPSNAPSGFPRARRCPSREGSLNPYSNCVSLVLTRISFSVVHSFLNGANHTCPVHAVLYAIR